jgi:ferredoxin
VAIFHSHEYENASYTRDMQVIDWVDPRFVVKNPNAKPMAKDKPKPAAKPAAPAAAPKAEHAPAPAATATATAGQAGVASGIGGTAVKIGDRGKVKNVWIIEGCIVCDLCEDTAPDVFDVTETTSTIKPDHKDRWSDMSDAIIDSAVGCPVNVIHYELE